MENLDEILNLITGNLAEEQKIKVLSEINQKTESQNLYRKAKTTWALMASTREMADYRVEKSYQELHERILSARKNRIFSTYLKYAAVIILFIGISTLIYFEWGEYFVNSTNSVYYTSVVAEKGQVSKVVLPDSSVVWLNSETTLTYNNNYSRNNRDLELNGQAFFDVRKNKQLPLIVFSNNLKVKVLGTRFDVKAYPDDKEVKVTLETGKVELLNSADKSFNYKMVPGQRATYNAKSNTVNIKNVDINNYLNWKEGVLQFIDTPMEEVIHILKRKYDVDFEVVDPKIYSSVFNATFKNESLREILNYIQFSCHLNFRLVKDKSRTKVILNY